MNLANQVAGMPLSNFPGAMIVPAVRRAILAGTLRLAATAVPRLGTRAASPDPVVHGLPADCLRA